MGEKEQFSEGSENKAAKRGEREEEKGHLTAHG